MKNIGITQISIIALVGIGAVLYAASAYVERQQQEMVASVKLEIVEQEKTLSNIAEITDRNGADAVVESIILDCSSSNRNRFDSLLDRLGTLNTSELDEVDGLFDACARFFAERKAVMVARMEREYEMFDGLVSLLSVVDDSISVAEYNVSEWDRLVTLEKKRSEIFDAKATIQKSIINELQDGKRVGSEEITILQNEAQSVGEEALVTNKQIDALRATLLDI